jgi:hypothetical protein
VIIPEYSSLRLLPYELSHKQVLIFDGIRYAAEMIDIAYQRLFKKLQTIAIQEREPTTRDIAIAILDAWSIIDSVNRFRDLIKLAPGVRNEPWKQLFHNRTSSVANLRDCVQHQSGEIEDLIANSGQIWDYLSWAEVRSGKHTGKWLMMSPGAVYTGSTWKFVGPSQPTIPLPLGRIRLNAFGCKIYLGQCVRWVKSAVSSLVSELENKHVRLVGEVEAKRQIGDIIYEGAIEVLSRVDKSD